MTIGIDPEDSMAAESLDKETGWGSAIRDGLSAAWPICAGYVAIGLAFGAIARNTGLRPLEIGLMSLIVYAGSAQFIATAMLGSGAGFLAIVLTTFSINLRHVLMSSSLSLHLRNLSSGWLTVFAYGVTDESFALNMGRFREGNWEWRRALVVNHATNLTWIASTVAGSIGGQYIRPGAWGLDYALVAMFTCLLVFQLRGLVHIVVALCSGVVAVVISLWIPGNGYVLIASFLAATAGLYLQQRRIRKNGEEDTP